MSTADLPCFSITSLGETYCAGRFDGSPTVGEDHIGCLYLGDGRFLWGRFRGISVVEPIATFVPDEPAELTAVRAGAAYPYFDGYAGHRAELVLSELREWRMVRFEPRDMVRYPNPGGGWMGMPASSDAPPGGDLVVGGWDHEHCFICFETISESRGRPTGYVSEQDWACEHCYLTWIRPKSLAFLKPS